VPGSRNNDNLTTVETHSDESSCQTILGSPPSDSHVSESNFYLGKRYPNNRSGFTQNQSSDQLLYSPLGKFKELLKESDFGCDDERPSSDNVEFLGPDLSLKSSYGVEDDEQLKSNLIPNLLPPEESGRGAFLAESDNEDVALPEGLNQRESSYFENQSNNPRTSTTNIRVNTRALLDRRINAETQVGEEQPLFDEQEPIPDQGRPQ